MISTTVPSDQGSKAMLAADLSLLMACGNNGKRTRGTRRDDDNKEEDVEEEAGAEEDEGDFFNDIFEEEG
jgi:hypothetical protein